MPLLGTANGMNASYTSPGAIGGALPWGRSSGGAGITAAMSGDWGGVGAAYDTAYNNALAMNQSNYDNILKGYQDSLASQTTAQQAIQAGYSDLYNNVLDKVTGIGQARANQINDASDQALARGSQQLIDRGLGNTTVQSSVARGVEGDRNQRQLELSDSLARMTGDYMSNLGLAGLSSRERGLGNQMNWMGRQLDFQNSVTAKYPDAGLYADLARTAAQNDQPRGGYGGGAFAGAGGIPRGPQDRLGYIPDRGPQYPAGTPQAAAAPGGGGGYGNVAGGIGAYIQAGQDFSGGYGGGGSYGGVSPGYDMPVAPDPLNAGAALGHPDPYAQSAAGLDYFGGDTSLFGGGEDPWY